MPYLISYINSQGKREGGGDLLRQETAVTDIVKALETLKHLPAGAKIEIVYMSGGPDSSDGGTDWKGTT